MKIFSTIILLIVFSHCSYSQSHQWQTQSLQNDALFCGKRVASLDSSTYIVSSSVAGDKYYNIIEETKDYGQTWDTLYFEDFTSRGLNVFQSYIITDIEYLDQNNIIAILTSNRLFRSTDAGKTWRDTTFFDEDFRFNQISANDSTLFLSGSYNRLARSTDMGNSWTLQSLDYQIDSLEKYEYIVHGVTVFAEDKLYTQVNFKDKIEEYCTLDYFIHTLWLESTDNGTTWKKLHFNNSRQVSYHYAVDEDYIYTQTREYTFKNTPVKNSKGEIDTLLVATPHYEIVKINSNTGDLVVLADSNSVDMININSISKFGETICFNTLSGSYISTDNGTIWNEEPIKTESPNKISFDAISRVSPTKGMAFGRSIFATLQPATSVTEKLNTLQNISVYPNPVTAGNKINLEFDAKEAGIYSYQLCSVEGRIIDIETRSFFPSGKASISLELSDELAKGVYFMSVICNETTIAIEKIIIE